MFADELGEQFLSFSCPFLAVEGMAHEFFDDEHVVGWHRKLFQDQLLHLGGVVKGQPAVGPDATVFIIWEQEVFPEHFPVLFHREVLEILPGHVAELFGVRRRANYQPAGRLVAAGVEPAIDDLAQHHETEIPDGKLMAVGLFFAEGIPVDPFGPVFAGPPVEVILVGERHPHHAPDRLDPGFARVVEVLEQQWHGRRALGHDLFQNRRPGGRLPAKHQGTHFIRVALGQELGAAEGGTVAEAQFGNFGELVDQRLQFLVGLRGGLRDRHGQAQSEAEQRESGHGRLLADAEKDDLKRLHSSIASPTL